MPVSDDMSKLAVRAKEAEDRVTAAREKAKADLEEDVDFTRTAVEKQNAVLRELASESKGRVSDHWHDLQVAWNETISGVRGKIEDRKAEHDLHKAERQADRAEEDAGFAADFAYSAIVEAEYAALDAALARMEADELSKQAGASA
jgi:hypothetical protein